MSTTAQIQEIYVGLLGRAADAEGLAYWTAEIDGGVLTIEQLRANIVNEQPEWQAGLGLLSREDLVDSLYSNLFGREPDVAGLTYWVSGGGASVNADQLVLALSNGAASADRAVLDNKTSAATYYTNNVSAYDASEARSAVSSVDGTVASLSASKASTNTLAGAETITLTTATTETVTGSTANDNYVGLISSTASKTTFNSTDFVTDASTTDSDLFTLTVNDDFAAADTPSVRNVENLAINLDASTTAAGPLGASAANEFVATVTNFQGVSNYTIDVTKTITGVNDVLLDDAEDDSTVTLSDDFSAGEVTVETAGDNVTINTLAAGSTSSPVVITLTAGTAPGDVTVTGAGDLSVQATTATGIVNATAEKGLTINSAAALVVIGEAKSGDLTVTNGDAAVIINTTATGNISITDSGAGAVNATAGGTVTLIASGAFAATSVNLSSVGASTIVGSSVGTATLSGNGAAATYTAESSDLTAVSVTGDNDVTLKVSASVLDANTLTVSDSGAGTFTLEIGTAGTAGDVDLSRGDVIDRLELAVQNDGKTLTVASGQNVTITTDQGNAVSTIATGTAAAASSNTVTLSLDDETRDANAVDLDQVTLTQAKTVTIDASIDSSSTGTAVTHIIDDFTASGANSNVTVNMGANSLSLDGAVTVGTGTLAITGSGAVTDATLVLTAATFDASAFTGTVTLDGTLNASTIKTGSGADDVALSNDLGGTFDLGAGNDRLTLMSSAAATSADYDGTTNVIDLGDGSLDVLEFGQNTSFVTGTSGSISLAGVEIIEFASAAGQEIQGNVLSGETYTIKSTAASNTNSVAVVVDSADSAIDLSGLVGSTATATTVAGMSFVTDASANTSLVSITGIDAAKNTITGSSTTDDVLTGGGKADTFVYASDALLFNSDGLMLDTIAGGVGTDVLSFGTAAQAFSIAATDEWSKLSTLETLSLGVATTAAISIDLDVTAETAGIVTVNLATDTTVTNGENTVDVSEYTSTAVTITGSSGVDNITGGAGADVILGGTGADVIDGGAGADTITGGGGIDTIDGGAGADSLVYKLEGDLITGNAVIDSITGGDGTDSLTIGTSGTTFTILAADVLSRMTGVEQIVGVANTHLYSISLDSTAANQGVTTVDISAGTAAASNVIDISDVTTANTNLAASAIGMTLTGSATGVTSITGGDGADTMTGGVLGDTFDGNGGADIIYVGSDTAADTVVLNASDSGAWASVAGTAVAVTDYDVIYNLGIGDKIDIGGYSAGSTSADDTLLVEETVTKGSDLTVTVTANSVDLIRGDYSAGLFTESSTGADAIMIYDANVLASAGGTDADAVVLIGVGSNTFTTDANAFVVIS